ncbi:MAG: DUF6502 family protein [Gammaproteobacteria bacterium]
MSNFNKIINRAVIKILQPLVRILLRHNISHSEFTELARHAYVSVAFKHFSIPNRKKTNSRVSVITGLSRKEVVRVAEIEEEKAAETRGPINRATRVVNGWLKDKDFLNSENKPRQLNLQEGEHGFEELVKRYSGGTPARAILDELLRVGAVERLDKKNIKLNHYGYLPENSDSELIDVFSTHVADLLDTCNFNLNRKKSELARFQRQVTYVDVPVSLADEFQAHSHEQLLSLVVEMNQWLATKNDALEETSTEPTCRVGIGTYFFKNEINSENKDHEV